MRHHGREPIVHGEMRRARGDVRESDERPTSRRPSRELRRERSRRRADDLAALVRAEKDRGPHREHARGLRSLVERGDARAAIAGRRPGRDVPRLELWGRRNSRRSRTTRRRRGPTRARRARTRDAGERGGARDDGDARTHGDVCGRDAEPAAPNFTFTESNVTHAVAITAATPSLFDHAPPLDARSARRDRGRARRFGRALAAASTASSARPSPSRARLRPTVPSARRPRRRR